jgi:acylphosphatase
MTEHFRLRALVTGRVQGVGFRFFTQSQAQRLALNGWVRNLPDGSVECLAEGSKADLLSFLEALWEGPSSSNVRNVHSQWLNATGEYQGFHISHY